MSKDDWPREKNWKHVYTRSKKLHRAKQLGFEYPCETESEMAERESLKLLFVCSRNQWRSPTAENVYSDKPLTLVRSCGTSRNARRTVTASDLQWADIVMVMEPKHRQRLISEYPGEMRFKETHVLNVPDDYRYMDPELIVELRAAIDPILADKQDAG